MKRVAGTRPSHPLLCRNRGEKSTLFTMTCGFGDCPDFRVNENGTVPFGPRLDRHSTKIFTGPDFAAHRPLARAVPRRAPVPACLARGRRKAAGGRSDALVVVRQHDSQVVDVDLAVAVEIARRPNFPLWL